MRVVLHTETDLTLEGFEEEGFEIQSEDEDLAFGPMQMFVTSLGLCSYSVVVGYGEGIGVETSAIEIRMRWGYAEKPYRMEPIDMEILWPGLPESRMEAARRAAEHCTLHHTLLVPTEVNTRVFV